MSFVDVSTIVLTRSEKEALVNMSNGTAPSLEMGSRLNRLSLASWVIKGDSGYWKINANGERYLEYVREQRKIRMRDSRRYWITTVLAILAFTLSVR